MSKVPEFPKMAALVTMIGVAVVASWGLSVLLWGLRQLPGYDNGGN